ncbi:hypothetical protein Tco_0648049 [Tanacetum coccineum]
MGDADEHEDEKAMRLIIRREKPATLSNVNLQQGIVTALLEKTITVRGVLKHEFLNLAVGLYVVVTRLVKEGTGKTTLADSDTAGNGDDGWKMFGFEDGLAISKRKYLNGLSSQVVRSDLEQGRSYGRLQTRAKHTEHAKSIGVVTQGE